MQPSSPGQAERPLESRGRTASKNGTGEKENTITTALQTLQTFLGGLNLSPKVKDAWKRVKEEAEGPGKGRGADGGTLADIAAGVKETVRLLKGSNTRPVASYAAAVKAGILGPREEKAVPVPQRQRREVIISPKGETPAQRQRTNREIYEDIQRAGGKGILTTRRLPSGDIAVICEDNRAKEALEETGQGVQGAAALAEIRRRTYIVLAHGISIKRLDLTKTKEATHELYQLNKTIQGKVDILGLKWAQKNIGSRTRATLQIKVASSTQANLLIDRGLVVDCQIHYCEPFVGECRVTQCYKCYKYGHIAAMCKSLERCGYCSKTGHKTADCMHKGQPEKHQCSACEKTGARHVSWSSECPTRRANVERARLCYAQRPTRYQEERAQAREEPEEGQGMEGVEVTGTRGQKRALSISSSSDADQDNQAATEFRVVERKRGRGRPPLLSYPEKGTQDIRQRIANRPPATQ